MFIPANFGFSGLVEILPGRPPKILPQIGGCGCVEYSLVDIPLNGGLDINNERS